MKKAFWIVPVLLFLATAIAFASGALDATNAAKALAPEGFEYAYTERDGKTYEVHFLNRETFEDYEITVNAETGAPVKIESSLEGAHGSLNIVLTEEEARQILLNEYPEASIEGIVTETDDGLYEITVYFLTNALYGKFDISPETGAVLERDIRFGAPGEKWTSRFASNEAAPLSDPAPGSSAAQPEANSFLSVSQARSVITDQYAGAKITEIEFDRENGKYVYEGEAVYNGREYDFKINAVTGKLIQWERD